MAAQVIPFQFDTQEIRTLLIDDQPWFCASDICRVLGYRNSRDALSKHCREKGVAKRDTPSEISDVAKRDTTSKARHSQTMTFIDEGNLYRLIIKSRKEEALRFESWVCDEVLPAIRQHGHYHDTNDKMGTLIGQTIGTDGFHMLGALIKGKVTSLPASQQRRAVSKLWSQTHAAFGVRSAADIPADQLDAARNFVAAYAIEGDYLEKQSLPAPTLETIHYPLTRPWHEWQPHHMVGTDAMYHSDIRRLIKQLLEASRSGTALQVSSIANVQEELKALAHQYEMEAGKKRCAEEKLANIESFVGTLTKTTGCLQRVLAQ